MMSAELNRRDFLAGAVTAGTTGQLPSVSPPNGAPGGSQVKGPVDGLAYWKAKDLVAALLQRKISAVELLDDAIKRIDAFDSHINAVVVRDFDRARAAAREADAALARGGATAAARPPDDR